MPELPPPPDVAPDPNVLIEYQHAFSAVRSSKMAAATLVMIRREADPWKISDLIKDMNDAQGDHPFQVLQLRTGYGGRFRMHLHKAAAAERLIEPIGKWNWQLSPTGRRMMPALALMALWAYDTTKDYAALRGNLDEDDHRATAEGLPNTVTHRLLIVDALRGGNGIVPDLARHAGLAEDAVRRLVEKVIDSQVVERVPDERSKYAVYRLSHDWESDVDLFVNAAYGLKDADYRQELVDRAVALMSPPFLFRNLLQRVVESPSSGHGMARLLHRDLEWLSAVVTHRYGILGKDQMQQALQHAEVLIRSGVLRIYELPEQGVQHQVLPRTIIDHIRSRELDSNGRFVYFADKLTRELSPAIRRALAHTQGLEELLYGKNNRATWDALRRHLPSEFADPLRNAGHIGERLADLARQKLRA